MSDDRISCLDDFNMVEKQLSGFLDDLGGGRYFTEYIKGQFSPGPALATVVRSDDAATADGADAIAAVQVAHAADATTGLLGPVIVSRSRASDAPLVGIAVTATLQQLAARGIRRIRYIVSREDEYTLRLMKRLGFRIHAGTASELIRVLDANTDALCTRLSAGGNRGFEPERLAAFIVATRLGSQWRRPGVAGQIQMRPASGRR